MPPPAHAPQAHLVHFSNQLGVTLAAVAVVGGCVAVVVHLASLIQVVDGLAIEARAAATAPVAVNTLAQGRKQQRRRESSAAAQQPECAV